MNSQFEDPKGTWRECENAWARWLNLQGYTVHLLSGAVGNATTTLAPLATTPGPAVRQPDISAAKAGVTEYWEVKFRSSPDIDPVTGVHHYWMSRAAFNDYRRLARATQLDVNVILFEAPTATSPEGRWLRASTRELRDSGQGGTRPGRDGRPINAWIWPVSAMTEVPGPPIGTGAEAAPILHDEGEGVWLDDAALERAERRRRWPEPGQTSDGPQEGEDDTARRLIDSSMAAGLAALCSALGITPLPRYSVTLVGDSTRTDDLLALIDYGIRVFTVTEEPLKTTMPVEQLDALRGARLLEDAVVMGLPPGAMWAVDGRATDGDATNFHAAMKRADEVGGLNYGQWRVVHAPEGENVLVRAGAGTGKTEVMAERMLFLLSTQRAPAKGSPNASQLTPGHFAFVTFTGEAALQMRGRLSRTLMLRQRLCCHCVSPVVAWMLQLSGARVSTIHSFAKELIQQTGAAVGYAPNFRVGQLTMDFRHQLQAHLSPALFGLNSTLSPHDKRAVPPTFEWEDHLEAIWRGLENKGLPLMQLDGGTAPEFDWGAPQAGKFGPEVFSITQSTLKHLATTFGERCRDAQVVPTSQLVPLAVSSVQESTGQGMKELKHLFVDEFQDTDALQIRLFLDVHQRTGAAMFAVGDIKQGIYRFRGATGNAFNELEHAVDERGLKTFTVYGLTRNFRSGRKLLDSLHPLFNAWGQEALLPYGTADALRADEGSGADESRGVQSSVRTRWSNYAAAQQAADVILGWRATHPDAPLAILCRENWQAREVKDRISEKGGRCLVYVGGEFFQTPAVAEVRVLLEAITMPIDNAALLELAESRWGAGILSAGPPDLLAETDAEAWRNTETTLTSWRSRMGTLEHDDTLGTTDLQGLRQRLLILRGLLTRSSVVGLLVDCVAWFAPDAVERPAEVGDERARYSNCINHLITLISNTFDDGAASPMQVLEWLRLQIAVNHDEDEPFEQSTLMAKGVTVALSVHKAKGLEYDRVLIPFTSKAFERKTPARGRTEVSVLDRPTEKPLLMWRWRPRRQDDVIANYPAVGLSTRENQHEVLLEETRLLYVALTRARHEVHVFRCRSGGVQGEPDSWSDLLSAPWSQNG